MLTDDNIEKQVNEKIIRFYVYKLVLLGVPFLLGFQLFNWCYRGSNFLLMLHGVPF